MRESQADPVPPERSSELVAGPARLNNLYIWPVGFLTSNAAVEIEVGRERSAWRFGHAS